MQEILRETIKKAAAGDVSAFEDIYRALSRAVFAIALGITRNRQDAEDVTQEVFIKVHGKLGSFMYDSSFGTWVYRIAVNTAINRYHQRARRASLTTNIEEVGELPDRCAQRAEAESGRTDAAGTVAGLLDALSPDHRAVVALREIEGLDYKEMAGSLGIPVNTVRSRLARAREAMAAILREGGLIS